MKAPSATVKITTLANWLIIAILVVLPFHAFLTVWLNSILGHYTLLRLWKEILVVILALLAGYLCWTDKQLRSKLWSSRLNQLIIAYLFVLIIWGFGSYLTNHVTLKALGYGLIVDGRFPAFFLIVSLFASHNQRLKNDWPKLILWPAILVAVIGLVQYFLLPYDFLRHFGYNAATIYPYETINHNVTYIRVMSTLRGANPLGAYLVLAISLVAAAWLKLKQRRQLAIALVLAGALVLSFSRSAWIGMVLALGTVAWISLHAKRGREVALASVAGLVVVLVAAFLLLHHNTAFQNAVYHTDDKSKIATSSNQGHASALKSGLKDVAREPLGEGVGTAGPASVYNHNKVRIAENYFVQIAQETGWFGVALFVAIQLYLARELWRRRTDTLALGLLAALIGLSFVNLLSHAWADDTLAYLFWGLAGIAVSSPLAKAATRTKKVAS